MNDTLWFSPDRQRCFLVPDDAELPPGDLVLRTSIGRRMEVDAAAAVPFEVSREEAAEWSREQLKGLFGGMKKEEPDEERPDDAPLPLFSTLSGVSAEELRSDPEALKRGLREVGAKLGAVLKDATSVSAEQRERAEVRLEELRAAVAAAEAAKGGAGAAEAEAKREGAEKALRSFADLVGSLGRAAERAGAGFAAAADELKARREAAESAEAEGGESEDEV